MKKRIDLYDIVKGIGILSVVVGHAMNTDYFYSESIDFFRRFIYMYNLVIFVFVSGRFIDEKNNISIFIKKKIKSLYIPYILINIILLFIQIFINIDYLNLKKLSGIITNILLLNSNVYLSSFLWFIQVLFFSELVYFLILKIGNSFIKKYRLLFYLFVNIACVVLGTTFLKYQINSFNIDLIFLLIPFLYIGKFFKYYQKQIDNFFDEYSNKIISLILFFILLCICYFFPNHQIELSKRIFMGKISIFYLVSFLSILFIYSVSTLIIRINHLKNIIIIFGQNSFFIMGFHNFFFYCVDKIYMLLVGIDVPYNGVISFPKFRFIYILVTLLLSYIYAQYFVFITKKIKISKLFKIKQ